MMTMVIVRTETPIRHPKQVANHLFRHLSAKAFYFLYRIGKTKSPMQHYETGAWGGLSFKFESIDPCPKRICSRNFLKFDEASKF